MLLPTPRSKLELLWQGPYTVTKVLDDGLNHELHNRKTHEQHRVYHINLLSKWPTGDETAALVMPDSESTQMSLPHENNVPQIDNETWEDFFISFKLSDSDRKPVKELLRQYDHFFVRKY